MTTANQKNKTQKNSKTRLRLWLHLLKTSRIIENEIREKLSTTFNTTLPRFDVMAALSQHKNGLKMNELSGALRVSNGNVTGIVERLLSDGLVERNSVLGDRRALKVSLTKKGLIEFSRQARTHKKWINELLKDLSEEDALWLNECLADLSRKILSKNGEK